MAAYEAQVAVVTDDGAQGMDSIAGEDPVRVAAWLRAQADRIDPQGPATVKAEES